MNSTKISQLQILQQNLQNTLLQKQQIQNSIVEFESALSELKVTDKAYKIIGNIMVASSKDNLSKDINEKKDIAVIRLNNFVKQEERLKKNIEELQKEVVDKFKKNE
ncbi:MAG: prefoldin subunit beta [Nanoarchaeota archaeon]|nr:prefoldin subunit beta [Nanoarchaeota archaeon]MBU1632153.1 prefoldin subunit beta [Nanoarchaeota archaeon]MBU1876354.1 prefoldin subunit beta [Nanoarchaeota archaeon]